MTTENDADREAFDAWWDSQPTDITIIGRERGYSIWSAAHASQLTEIKKLRSSVSALESLRPHWAKGFSSDSSAAQAATAALAQVWGALEVENQTHAMAKLRDLLAHARQPGEPDGDAWREDPAADERWNVGCDFAMEQLCVLLGVDQASVSWEAATEEVDGDVRAVLGNIMDAGLGENWRDYSPAAPIPPAGGDVRGLREALEQIAEPLDTSTCIGDPWAFYADLQAVARATALLYGPPGTGKTTLAHHLAARLGLPLVAVQSERLVGSHLGETGRNIAALFDGLAAAEHGCVVLLDEIDSIGSTRSSDPQAGALWVLMPMRV